jgi:signal transduction histidine kinase
MNRLFWERYRPCVCVALVFRFQAPPSLFSRFSIYVLPLAIAAFVITVVVWRLNRHDNYKLPSDLKAGQELLAQREKEQEEVFRRLYEGRELNKEKTQFQAQLAEYEKYAALAQLALGAAHEINNPLLVILSRLELELKSSQGEQRIEVEQCIDGARHISATLRGLLNYARPGPLVLSRISLPRLLADTLTFLEHQPLLRGKHVENNVPSDLPLICADAKQLSQVLMNLLLNAAEATPEGGHITIATTKLTYVD